MPRGGWPLVALAATGVALMVAAILGVRGVGEEGVRACVRATARSSALLFLGAFVASMLRRRWRNPFTGWLIRNRRYLGVSFAASHAIHLGALVALLQLVPCRARAQGDRVDSDRLAVSLQGERALRLGNHHPIRFGISLGGTRDAEQQWCDERDESKTLHQVVR